ncbi:hypothetical protein ACLBXM_18035 [Xanthobacteraceae bacterium A53D]
MTDLTTAVIKAAESAAARQNIPLHRADAAPVALAIAQAMPAPKAMEPLWPQLIRYGVSMLGTALAARGVGTEADWEVLAGIIIAAAPPAYRVISTMIARRKAA